MNNGQGSSRLGNGSPLRISLLAYQCQRKISWNIYERYHQWEWEDAFSKFGFGDGDGWNGTHEVEGEIESLGYEVVTDTWGCHNYMIFDIKKDGKSILFPEDKEHKQSG